MLRSGRLCRLPITWCICRRNASPYQQYGRLAARRGGKWDIVAVAHSLLVIIYHVISRREAYQELGADYFARRKLEAVARRLVRHIMASFA
jgi:hypothetical protein